MVILLYRRPIHVTNQQYHLHLFLSINLIIIIRDTPLARIKARIIYYILARILLTKPVFKIHEIVPC